MCITGHHEQVQDANSLHLCVTGYNTPESAWLDARSLQLLQGVQHDHQDVLPCITYLHLATRPGARLVSAVHDSNQAFNMEKGC